VRLAVIENKIQKHVTVKENMHINEGITEYKVNDYTPMIQNENNKVKEYEYSVFQQLTTKKLYINQKEKKHMQENYKIKIE